MEKLEQHRLAKLQKSLSRECGLIIPIVLRGEDSLPKEIRTTRHYYSFERFSLTSRELAKIANSRHRLEDSNRVDHRKQMFDTLSEDLTGDCDDFSFPTEDEVRPSLDAVITPTSPFPFRATP